MQFAHVCVGQFWQNVAGGMQVGQYGNFYCIALHYIALLQMHWSLLRCTWIYCNEFDILECDNRLHYTGMSTAEVCWQHMFVHFGNYAVLNELQQHWWRSQQILIPKKAAAAQIE